MQAPKTIPKVIHVFPVPEDYLSPLHGVAEVLQPGLGDSPWTREELMALGRQQGISGLIVPGEFRVDEDLLEALPGLRIVANTAVGYDNLPVELMARRGIWATNTPDSFVDATADATLGLLLAVVRKLVVADRYIRSGGWPQWERPAVFWEGMELRGKTMGILGYGCIGEAVGRRAEAFGMRVIFHRRKGEGNPAWREMPVLLAEADVLSLHVPLTPETHHLIDGEALARMKRGAFLLNLARGAVVDEGALVEALERGHLAGAGLDVFEEEPRVHPGLLTREDVVLAPHLGGATREARRHARQVAAENVARVLRGERPLHPLVELV